MNWDIKRERSKKIVKNFNMKLFSYLLIGLYAEDGGDIDYSG